ncbi:MAG: iron ABC transporter permease [Desulfarculales bacterium]|jgi:iron complex transport system permease protein|nr:iron ABC transporter permease [Desulfarculales bacterium]
MNERFLRLLLMAAALIGLSLLSLSLGGGNELPAALWGGDRIASLIIWEIRLPRILLAISGGASLALAGAALQAILMNPLVDPYLLGISAGASLGAALAIVLGFSFLSGAFWLVGNAFIFALLVALMVYALARSRQAGSYTIILAGLAMNFIFSALVGGLQYMAQEAGLRDLMFWIMGSLWNAGYTGVIFIFLILLPSLIILLSQAWNLNSLAAGAETAHSLGVNLSRLHLLVVLVACLLTAAAVSFMGAVSFVGLVGPHIGREITGGDHRFLLPGAALCGAILLLGADTLARLVLWPMDLPVGIMTALLGGPFFIYLLLKGRKNSWL